MAWSGFLLWVSASTTKRRLPFSDPTKDYVSLMAYLRVLEELFRAIFEVHGRRVMIVTPDGADRVRCELAMLDGALGSAKANASEPLMKGRKELQTVSKPGQHQGPGISVGDTLFTIGMTRR